MLHTLIWNFQIASSWMAPSSIVLSVYTVWLCENTTIKCYFWCGRWCCCCYRLLTILRVSRISFVYIQYLQSVKAAPVDNISEEIIFCAYASFYGSFSICICDENGRTNRKMHGRHWFGFMKLECLGEILKSNMILRTYRYHVNTIEVWLQHLCSK